MTYTYHTKGVCSRQIVIDLEDGVVQNVQFIGGCSGNTQGVAALAKGQKAQTLIQLLQGIRCGNKNSSCPDQLAEALKQALAQ
ncbi:MAG TPA: TIGR03905 family TSCPD domain-containing protein [Firmicutes bacterium]|nr:TIGR03905 family TSCPD domain-containing protein [Bacillota bacterium]